MSGAATKSSGVVGRIWAVHSCKGGVGKSTVAAGLALALKRAGRTVGLLDADMHGPSLPVLLRGLPAHEPEVTPDGRQLAPFISEEGIVCQSFAFVARLWRRRLGEGSVVLRGSLVSELTCAMANHTRWGGLDHLVVDMPPGTGDIPQALLGAFPADAAVVVSTPHALAVADTVKGLEMLKRLKVPVGALVQNMALYRCAKCGEEARPFGQSAAEALLKRAPKAPLVELPICAEGSGLGEDTRGAFDALARALEEVRGPPGGHRLPVETQQWSIPHWPTLMATAKLELK